MNSEGAPEPASPAKPARDGPNGEADPEFGLFCDGAIAGAFGGIMGFALVLLWLERIQSAAWWRFGLALVIVLTVQHLLVEPMMHRFEWGRKASHERSTVERLLATMLVLALMEVFVMAAESVADLNLEHVRIFGAIILGSGLAATVTTAWQVTVFVVLWVVIGGVVAGLAARSVIEAFPRTAAGTLKSAGMSLWTTAWTVAFATLGAVFAARGPASYWDMTRNYTAWNRRFHSDLSAFRQSHAGILGEFAHWSSMPVDRIAETLNRHGVTGWWILLAIPMAGLAGGLVGGEAGFFVAIAGVLLPPVLPTLLTENNAPLAHFVWVNALVWSIPAVVLGASVPWLETQTEKPTRWVLLASLAACGLAVLAVLRTEFARPLFGGAIALAGAAAVLAWRKERRLPWLAIGLALAGVVAGGAIVQDTLLGDLSFSNLCDRYRDTLTAEDLPVPTGDVKHTGTRIDLTALLGPERLRPEWADAVHAGSPGLAADLAAALAADSWTIEARALKAEGERAENADRAAVLSEEPGRLRALAQRIDAFSRAPAGPGGRAAASLRGELRVLAAKLDSRAESWEPPSRKVMSLKLEIAVTCAFGFWAALGILLAWTRAEPRPSQ